jgi:hypothetical protein
MIDMLYNSFLLLVGMDLDGMFVVLLLCTVGLVVWIAKNWRD